MKLDVAKAKELVLSHLATGMKVADAMAAVSRSGETYRDWRKNDPAFKAAVERIRSRVRAGDVEKSVVPDFPEFSAEYLRQPLPQHQLRAWDVICGREPRDMHPSMTYQRGVEDDDQVILNFPPNHAKSTTWTMNWVTWLIHKNPAIRVIVVSKTQRLAKQFLLGIKQRLTNPVYQDMHAAFAPQGGWRSDDKADGLAWREDMIYVRGRDPQEKDPTVQALGIGGAIYGSRADLVILDDCEDLGNYGSYEAHATWVAQEVSSRLEPGSAGEPAGRLVILGTRVGAVDLYRHLRDDAKTLDDEPAYTYFSQPAILEGETDPDTDRWTVLWPERMTARVLKKKRSKFTNPRHFQLIYQQQDIPDSSTFDATCVRAAVNGQRYHGPMVSDATGHRREGMEGLYVIGAWDPASSAGNNAMCVMGVDRRTQKRWVLDTWNMKGATPRDWMAKFQAFTTQYGIREWRIEKNAVQEAFIHLDEIKLFCSTRGVLLRPHHTGKNKLDSEIGVETLAPLFESCADRIGERYVPRPAGKGLIELPSSEKSPTVQMLVQQLVLWEPGNKRQVQDLVMALWFAELAARDYLRGGIGNITHLKSRYASRAALRSRSIVPVERLGLASV